MNQMINVAIAEKLAQLRTAQWFKSRIAGADSKAGAKLIRDLTQGGEEKPSKDDAAASVRVVKKRRRGRTVA